MPMAIYCTKLSNIKAPRRTLISVMCARATTVHIMENKEQVTGNKEQFTVEVTKNMRRSHWL